MRNDTTHHNLNSEQIHAFKSLKNNIGITIKASDKGGNIVLMDNINYENLCLKILKITCYCKISPSLVNRFSHEFYSLIDEALNEGAIKKDTWDFI